MAKKYGDYKQSVKEGKSAEDLFLEALQNKYPDTKPRSASFFENYVEHKDVIATGNDGEEHHFDAKNAKRVKRRGNDGVNEYSDDYTWVEVMNNQGKPGWLYGKQEFLAFNHPSTNRFIVVDRNDLIELIDKNTNKDILFEENINIPEYGRYRRSSDGNKDIIVLTPIKDICSIAKFYVEY